MANIRTNEEKLHVMCRVIRSRITQLEMEIGDSDGSDYGTFLIAATNKILDCALDLSKEAAIIERAIASTSSRVLSER